MVIPSPFPSSLFFSSFFSLSPSQLFYFSGYNDHLEDLGNAEMTIIRKILPTIYP
jgi:hypothetical protein